MEMHVKHFGKVFNLLKQAGLTVKLMKCTFLFGEVWRQVKYLSFKFTRECVKNDSTKPEAEQFVPPLKMIIAGADFFQLD